MHVDYTKEDIAATLSQTVASGASFSTRNPHNDMQMDLACKE